MFSWWSLEFHSTWVGLLSGSSTKKKSHGINFSISNPKNVSHMWCCSFWYCFRIGRVFGGRWKKKTITATTTSLRWQIDSEKCCSMWSESGRSCQVFQRRSNIVFCRCAKAFRARNFSHFATQFHLIASRLHHSFFANYHWGSSSFRAFKLSSVPVFFCLRKQLWGSVKKDDLSLTRVSANQAHKLPPTENWIDFVDDEFFIDELAMYRKLSFTMLVTLQSSAQPPIWGCSLFRCCNLYFPFQFITRRRSLALFMALIRARTAHCFARLGESFMHLSWQLLFTQLPANPKCNF